MLADILDELIVGQAVDEGLETLSIVGRTQFGNAHRHELLAGIAVMGDGGLVDREEAQRLPVDHPHRHRIAFEQQAEGFLAVFRLGDVLMRCHPAAIGHRPMDDGDVTPVTQLVGGLVGDAARHVVEPRP